MLFQEPEKTRIKGGQKEMPAIISGNNQEVYIIISVQSFVCGFCGIAREELSFFFYHHPLRSSIPSLCEFIIMFIVCETMYKVK